MPFINDLPKNVAYIKTCLFADDTTFMACGKPSEKMSFLRKDKRAVDVWFTKNMLTLNVSIFKTQKMWLKIEQPETILQGTTLEVTNHLS